MHAILASIGTDGDIIPYVGLGAELRKRGHRVTLAVAEPWRKAAEELDLEFSPVVSNEEDREMAQDPDFWHPLKGPAVVAKWGRQFVARQYAQLAALCDSPDAVLVANSGLLPARVVNEKTGVPLASLILQPWMIKSSIAPPVMPAGLTLPTWAPAVVAKGYWRTFNFVGDLLVGKELNRLRQTLGLRPVVQVFDWWLSEQLVIGMFPEWYGPRQSDWISHVRLAGFPMFDGRANAELPEDVKRFCEGREPPIAFTFGTGMLHGERLFEAAVRACDLLGRRGILLSRHAAQFPGGLPNSILVCPYAPFGRLFPLCGAIVHHGGIGTTAKALASGRPQLVTPMAFDQLDNSIRVKQMGVGDFIKARRVTGNNLAAALKKLLGGQTKRQCEETAERFAGVDALAQAADWVEELATPNRSCMKTLA
jgi:UDP:flavonoid glycosyltransferase YjiC (YdhE family)